jgi:hypothetical protein
MRSMIAVLIAAGALSFEPVTGYTQELPDSESDLPQDAVDEVVVYGDKSLGTLRQAVYRAEEDFWAAFSAVNDDDEFDVTCFDEAPTGTHIRRHVCRANFVVDATSAEYEQFRTTGPRVVVRDPQTVIMSKRREFEERVTQLILENPKLAQAITRYHEAKDTYASERERQCEGRLIACRR